MHTPPTPALRHSLPHPRPPAPPAAPPFRSHNVVGAIDVGPEVVVVQFSVCNFMQLWHIRPQFHTIPNPPNPRQRFPARACGRMSEIVYNCIKFIILRNLYIYLFRAVHYGAAEAKPQGNQCRNSRWMLDAAADETRISGHLAGIPCLSQEFAANVNTMLIGHVTATEALKGFQIK